MLLMKMKTISIIVVLVMFLFLDCARFKFSTKSDTAFSRNCTITVVCNDDDALGIQKDLEDLLSSKGFNVVTETLARIKVSMQDRYKNKSLGESKAGTSSERLKEPTSVYCLRFSYKFYYLTVYQYYIFTNFTAKVVDLDTGEVVATADFSQSGFGTRSISSVLRAVVNKVTNSIRERIL